MKSISLAEDSLKSLLITHLTVDPDSLDFAEVGPADFDQRYLVNSDQGSFLLRIAPAEDNLKLFYEGHMMRREVQLLDLIRQKTTIPAPEIVAADFSHDLIERDYLIVKAPTGILYSQIKTLTHAQHDRVFFQLGQYLKQLHQITGAGYGYDGAVCANQTPNNWPETFKRLWQNLVKDIVNCGMYNPQEAEGLVSLLEGYGPYFERDEPPALLHMGVRKENILVDQEGNITGLLGFNLAMWGDPEIEFAALDCAGIWASAFWEGYGNPRPNDLGSRTRRKFYILYEVQKNMPISVWRRHDFDEADQYKQTTMTIATSLASSEP